MNRNQFERIFSRMGNEYGKIPRGDEERYTMVFHPIEGNAMKVHRKHPTSNSRRMREAIALALYQIKGRVDGEEYDTSAFRNEDNERLEKAILMAFDPFTNEAVRAIVMSGEDGSVRDSLPADELKDYYTTPVMCLLRIKDSIDLWEEGLGSDGYFDFMEEHMGHIVKDDETMDFGIEVKPDSPAGRIIEKSAKASDRRQNVSHYKR